MKRRRGRDPFELKSVDQLALMREAGLVVAQALSEMRDAVAPGVSTLDLDAIARDVLRAAGATSNFLGYDLGSGPYPGVICASVNDRIVHGIPSSDVQLRDGDLISLDVGAVVDGWHPSPDLLPILSRPSRLVESKGGDSCSILPMCFGAFLIVAGFVLLRQSQLPHHSTHNKD